MKKNLLVLLVAVMTMTLLSGCAVGGNSDTDNNQPTNPEGNVNVAEVDLEGVYWLCEDGEVMGFYLDGNGKYAELSGDGYIEGTYDCLQGVIENTVATYNFRTFDENGACKYVSCEVRSDGKVYIEEKGYAPVDEVAFNEYVPESSPEPEPSPEQNWSKPFMGKYYASYSQKDNAYWRGLYIDENYFYFTDHINGVSQVSISEYEITSHDGTAYSISPVNNEDDISVMYYYVVGEDSFILYVDGYEQGGYELVNKETYDSIGPN